MRSTLRDSSGSRSGLPTAALAAGAVAATAGLAALLWAAKRRRALGAGGGAAVSGEREQLLKILAELSRRFFHTCVDVAAIAKSVRTKIEANAVDITEDKLKEQLARQCKVFEKLEEIQTEVSREFGRSPSEVQAMQERASKDREVCAYTEGFRAMLEDSLNGLSPILPCAEVPKGLTEEKALEIQAEVHGLEYQKVKDSLFHGKITLKELGEVLASSHKSAWETTFEVHADLMAGAGPEVYHSAVAGFMRKPSFAEEKKKLDDMHQERMVKIFKADDRVTGLPP